MRVPAFYSSLAGGRERGRPARSRQGFSCGAARARAPWLGRGLGLGLGLVLVARRGAAQLQGASGQGGAANRRRRWTPVQQHCTAGVRRIPMPVCVPRNENHWLNGSSTS
ncbi:unnamed protein product [Eretmochelys imbricata]